MRQLFFSLGAILLASAFLDGYLCNDQVQVFRELNDANVEGNNGSVYSVYDKNLGYRPSGDGVFRTVKSATEEVLYDVQYTIRDNLRYTPNSKEESGHCALFFGCSATFGKGLPDHQTLPFHFNTLKGNRYRVLNYGLHGYGPHHVLAHIQDRVSKDLQAHPGDKIAIYHMMPLHLSGAAGYTLWDRHGPKYELVEGNLKRNGAFSKKPRTWLSRALSKLMAASYMYRKYLMKANHEITIDDLQRVIAILKKSNELLLQEGVDFYVLLHDIEAKGANYAGMKEGYRLFIDQIKQSDIKILYLSHAISDFHQNIDKYTIHSLDNHPSGLANKMIAQYLADNIH